MKKNVFVVVVLVAIVIVVGVLAVYAASHRTAPQQQSEHPTEASPFAVKYRQAQLEQQGFSTEAARRQAILDILRGSG